MWQFLKKINFFLMYFFWIIISSYMTYELKIPGPISLLSSFFTLLFIFSKIESFLAKKIEN